MKKNELIKANMSNVPAEMTKACENLQNVLNNVNASKKQLAKASYDLKVQAEESKLTFKDFIKEHFSMFDISESRIYALAQTAGVFDCEQYKALWERIPVSKLEKMCRIKKAKSNKSTNAFGYIEFLQCVSFRAVEEHNLAIEKASSIIEELEKRMKEASERQDFVTAQKCKLQIESTGYAQPIAVPASEEEQKIFYLNDGISRLCTLSDSKVGELVKLYNLYSDVVKPETDDGNDGNGNGNDGNGNDGNDKGSKEKTVPEQIADILARVQTLRETAEKNKVELPNSAIQAFVEAMQNFGK